jgi:daunorubicin resistance ABC transporter ATP-binding subunit
MDAMAVEADTLVRTYGRVKALDGLTLRAAPGAVLGLLGPNGSGKTTAVSILSTALLPDSGRASVCGLDVVRQASAVREVIGFAGQFAAVEPQLTGRENLVLLGRLSRLPRRRVAERAAELLHQFRLEDAADRLARTYSGGMRRRLDIAAALVRRPPVLFLDEPTTGLDPESRLGLWDTVRDLVREGTAVLLTTQYLEEADALADEVVVIDHGTVVQTGTPAQLKARFGAVAFTLGFDDERDARTADRLFDAAGHRAERTGAQVVVRSHQGSGALSEVLRTLDHHVADPRSVTVAEPTLDDVFLALTGTPAPPPPAADPSAPHPMEAQR